MITQITEELKTHSKNEVIAEASKADIKNEIVGIKAKCSAHLKAGGKNVPGFLQTWAELDEPTLGEAHLEIVLRKSLAQNKTFQSWVEASIPKKTKPEQDLPAL